MSKILCVIPARYSSSRFPGKPLANILKKPMIQWVYERVSNVEKIDKVIVATDDKRIYDCVNEFGGEAILTGAHNCGTNRIAEAVKRIDEDFDIILNIQGDEPMIKKEMIEDLISTFEDTNVYMATLKKEINSIKDINNPNIAKLITDKNDDAIYFSRSTIPYNRDGVDVKYCKHIGVYGYKKSFLLKIANMEQTNLEISEQLEQLRVIENGFKIRVKETKYESIGVDLPEHIKKVEENLLKEVESNE